MPLMNWNDNLSVGVSAMDNQHKVLMDLINSLNEAMGMGKGRDEMSKTIAGLKEYTQKHFAEEEAYLERFNYPDLAIQKAAHKQFVDKIIALEEEVQANKVGTALAAMQFLRTWLTDHIMGKDKKYGPLFNQNGIH